jgi:hypothetical protein
MCHNRYRTSLQHRRGCGPACRNCAEGTVSERWSELGIALDQLWVSDKELRARARCTALRRASLLHIRRDSRESFAVDVAVPPQERRRRIGAPGMNDAAIASQTKEEVMRRFVIVVVVVIAAALSSSVAMAAVRHIDAYSANKGARVVADLTWQRAGGSYRGAVVGTVFDRVANDRACAVVQVSLDGKVYSNVQVVCRGNNRPFQFPFVRTRQALARVCVANQAFIADKIEGGVVKKDSVAYKWDHCSEWT